MKPPRDALGSQNEVSATYPMGASGYRVPPGLSRHGGIDIAASQDQDLVFVEVNSPPIHSFDCPDASVKYREQAPLPSEVGTWLDQRPESGNTRQFGMPAVEGEPGAKAEIEDCGYGIG